MGTPEKGPSGQEHSDEVFNVYPKYFPNERLAELADVLLSPHDPKYQSEKNDSERCVEWVDTETGDTYYLEKVDRVNSIMGLAAQHIHRVTLTHVEKDSPQERVTNQFILESMVPKPSENSYAPIRQIVRNGLTLTQPLADEYSASDALNVLYKKPAVDGLPSGRQQAERLLQNRIDSSYKEEIVGEYILSEHAVVSGYNQPQTTITRDLVSKTVIEFTQRIEQIEDEEKTASLQRMRDSRATLKKFKDDADKTKSNSEFIKKMEQAHRQTEGLHMAVVDAIESPPLNGRHGSKYLDPDLFNASMRVLSRLPYKKWSNVPPFDKNLPTFVEPIDLDEPETDKSDNVSQPSLFDIDDTQPIDISQLDLDDDDEY